MLTDSDLAHYPNFRRTERSGENDRAYYNIEQFKHFRINQVSERGGNVDSFDDTTQSFDSDREGFDATDVNIPQNTFTTRINVPYPGEINISSTSSTSNFSDSFITFDDTINEFSESGSSSATPTVTDFSETLVTFDNNAEKFDEQTIGVPVDFSTIANTFDQTVITMDDG